MIFTFELEKEQIKISYRSEGGYLAKRNAILLFDELQKAGDVAQIFSEKTIFFDCYNQTVCPSDEYQVLPEGDRISVFANGILAYEGVQKYFHDVLHGNQLSAVRAKASAMYSDANRFAFDPQGNHRVMFYNVLWDNTVLFSPAERNIMASLIVREFAPEVVGMQECGTRKREEQASLDIANVMKEVGFLEALMPKVENNYQNINCTPLFYNPDVTEFLDGGYHWYRAQNPDAWCMDQASKSLSWGRFRSKKDDNCFIVISTHMCTQSDEVREAQAKEACELCDSLFEKYDVPLIFGGDFNSTVASKGYRYYHDVARYPDAQEEATVYTSQVKSYYRRPELDMKLWISMPTAEICDHCSQESIDHILFPHMPSEFRTAVFGQIVNPFALAASDHFPMYVDFSF
ncbi:MAG: endonuclease/exonuclease/phosphatase family protein [Clostridia bacterium]|nr:endonuclease/exonuclease/phosphatase family protein [Clostridia bacterium]